MLHKLHDLLFSTGFQVLAAIVTVLTALFSLVVVLLRRVQRGSLTAGDLKRENEYLVGLEKYLIQLHRVFEFDEQYFVSREYRIKDRYEARSFFVAKHRAALARLSNPLSNAGSESHLEGYYSSDISTEVIGTGEPLIILGEPGSGKSVSARELAIQIARQSLRTNSPDRLIPIFMSLSEYTSVNSASDPIDFYTFVENTLKSRGKRAAFATDFLLTHLVSYLDAGRLFLVLDSLDEMPPATFRARCKSIEDFTLRHANNCFVIACRANDFSGGIKGREAYLDHLKPAEIREFIDRRRDCLRGISTAQVFSAIRDERFILRSVIDNPFYLNLILHFYSITGFLPENYAVMFQVIARDWAEREAWKEVRRGGAISAESDETERIKSEVDRLITGLSAIAFTLSNSAGFGTYALVQELRVDSCRLGVSAELIDSAFKLGSGGGMLYIDVSENKVRFIHHKFQEYFAAEHLSQNLGRGVLTYDALPSICSNIWWEEVTAILASITGHPEEIIRVLCDVETSGPAGSVEEGDTGDGKQQPLLPRVLWLCGRCLQLVPDKSPGKAFLTFRVLGKAFERLHTRDGGIGSKIDAIRCLGLIEQEDSVSLLEICLKDRSPLIRELAFSSLASFQLGRTYLKNNIRWVAFEAYFKRSFFSQIGRVARKRWSLAFPGLGSRAIIACYAVASYLLRFSSIAVLLALSVLFLPILRRNVYALIPIGALLSVDVLTYPYQRRVPSVTEFIVSALFRTSLVALIAAAAYLRLLAAPWFVLPAYLGLVLCCIVAILIVMWRAEEAQRTRLRKLFPTRLGELFPTAPQSFSGFVLGRLITLLGRVRDQNFMDAAADAAMITLGLIDAKEYVAGMDLTELQKLAKQLENENLGGYEIELFEAIRDRQRQILQDTTNSTILDIGHGTTAR